MNPEIHSGKRRIPRSTCYPPLVTVLGEGLTFKQFLLLLLEHLCLLYTQCPIFSNSIAYYLIANCLYLLHFLSYVFIIVIYSLLSIRKIIVSFTQPTIPLHSMYIHRVLSFIFIAIYTFKNTQMLMFFIYSQRNNKVCYPFVSAQHSIY